MWHHFAIWQRNARIGLNTVCHWRRFLNVRRDLNHSLITQSNNEDNARLFWWTSNHESTTGNEPFPASACCVKWARVSVCAYLEQDEAPCLAHVHSRLLSRKLSAFGGFFFFCHGPTPMRCRHARHAHFKLWGSRPIRSGARLRFWLAPIVSGSGLRVLERENARFERWRTMNVWTPLPRYVTYASTGALWPSKPYDQLQVRQAENKTNGGNVRFWCCLSLYSRAIWNHSSAKFMNDVIWPTHKWMNEFVQILKYIFFLCHHKMDE